MALDTTVCIRVAAPDAPAALLLRRRLRDLDAHVVSRGSTWEVVVDDPRVDAATVRARIHDLLPETEPLGSGYDGPALEHEP